MGQGDDLISGPEQRRKVDGGIEKEEGERRTPLEKEREFIAIDGGYSIRRTHMASTEFFWEGGGREEEDEGPLGRCHASSLRCAQSQPPSPSPRPLLPANSPFRQTRPRSTSERARRRLVQPPPPGLRSALPWLDYVLSSSS